jgi:two-component system, OmpR family, response regulator
MHKILVVDHDVEIANLVGQTLEKEGYVVLKARTAKDALRMTESKLPDLFIINIGLPVMDGLSLCRKLRLLPLANKLPIIFVADPNSLSTVADALGAGGDDYLRKPFALRELIARVRAHLRRVNPVINENVPVIQLSLEKAQVFVNNRVVELTNVEFDLLKHLCLYPDKLHSTQDLLSQVWQYPRGTGDSALVRNHIRNLRRKLEDDPDRPEIVQSRHGRGYTIKAQIQILSGTMAR